MSSDFTYGKIYLSEVLRQVDDPLPPRGKDLLEDACPCPPSGPFKQGEYKEYKHKFLLQAI